MPLIYTDGIERASCPEEVGVDTFVLRDFFDELKSSEYSFKNIMILRHGKVAAECTRYPYVSQMPHTMFSFSKVISAIAIGFAVSEGLLRMDTSVAELFADTYDEKLLKKNEGITVRHLLTMTSGKKLHFANNYEKMDWLDNYISSPLKNKPGEKFKYLSENTYVLGRMLAKVSGQTISEYLRPRLFEPLKIDFKYWEKDKHGYDAAGWGLFLTVEDMAKISQCFLQKGIWNGVQVIPEGWTDAMMTPYIRDLYGLDAKNLGFGYNVWCGRVDGYCRFEGLYGQHAFLYTKHDACIVINSSGINHKLIFDLIDKYFPKAFKENLNVISEDIAAEFKEELTRLSYDVLPVSLRNYATESGLNGNTYSMKKNKHASMLPKSASYTLCEKPGCMDNISFNFRENYAEISWSEIISSGKSKGVNLAENTLCVNLDGKRRISNIRYDNMYLHMLAYGAWNKDGTLTVQIFTMEIPEVRTWVITFDNEKIGIKASIAPDLYESIKNKFRFQGIKINPILDLGAKIGGKIATDFCYATNMKGKLQSKDKR